MALIVQQLDDVCLPSQTRVYHWRGKGDCSVSNTHNLIHVCAYTQKEPQCCCLSLAFWVFTMPYEGGSWEAAIFSAGFIIPLTALHAARNHCCILMKRRGDGRKTTSVCLTHTEKELPDLSWKTDTWVNLIYIAVLAHYCVEQFLNLHKVRGAANVFFLNLTRQWTQFSACCVVMEDGRVEIVVCRTTSVSSLRCYNRQCTHSVISWTA